MSRSAACAFFAACVSFAVVAAGPARAADGPAPSAAGTLAAEAAPAAPVIEVVRDGGLAEAWREEGSAFATYGPDGQAVVPTTERQALQALANAYDVRFVRTGPADAAPVVVAGDTIDRYALARAVAAEALDEAKPSPAADGATYTHALAYSSDGHAWELRLCFECGRYALRRDGIDVGAGETGGTGRRAAFDALFADAGTAD